MIPKSPQIVAFLQNAWFKQPDRIAKMYASPDNAGPENRANLNQAFLFFGCLTGRRLSKAFGGLCSEIIWENANPGFVGQSSGQLPADHQHIKSVLANFKPQIVLTFGKIAHNGLLGVLPHLGVGYAPWWITGPHPAARHATVTAELAKMAEDVRSRMP